MGETWEGVVCLALLVFGGCRLALRRSGRGAEKGCEMSARKYLVFCPPPVDPCFTPLACLVACAPPGVDRRGHSSHGGGVPHPDRHGRQTACASG